MTTITIESLKDRYKSALQAEDSTINAFAPNSSWSIIAGGNSAVLLDLYANLKLVSNAIYIQNSIGDQVDQALFSEGLPSRIGETYAIINVTVTTTVPVVIPENTIFIDATTGNQYQILTTMTILDDTTSFVLYAIESGPSYLEAAGSELSATIDGDLVTVEVVSSVNGQYEESDQSCIERALTARRAPIAGARITDYQVYALEANKTLPSPVVTGSITVPAFYSINSVKILGLFVYTGTLITEYQLNLGLLPATTYIGYSRQASSDTITAVDNYIQSLRLVGQGIKVNTTITNVLSPMSVSVSLLPGYSLDTILTVESQAQDLSPITIQLTINQIIQKEIRRAICNQPFGGVKVSNQNTITLDSIYTSVNARLSWNTGSLVQILNNIIIAGGDIDVPNSNANAESVYYTYDFSAYSAITVSVL